MAVSCVGNDELCEKLALKEIKYNPECQQTEFFSVLNQMAQLVFTFAVPKNNNSYCQKIQKNNKNYG